VTLRETVKRNRKGGTVNLTMVFGIVSLVVWIVLAFVVAVPAGWVHLFYAGSVVLFARRVIAGAPQFRS